ncbi:MAG: SMC-Scp complex subunit ScpB [Patescibacteria group bacterium]|nr:SMC-Scp complex subunit ScpB [Patescibacteria group bacterium]
MEQDRLKNILESLLFVSSKPLRAKELAKFLELDETEVRQALASLASDRQQAGVVVLENNGEYQMSTQPANSTQVKNFLNLELREKLTDATVEVLAIIAYRQPISKAEIEAIRGVNSQYSLRHLLMRGLIEKIPNPRDARGFLYQTTTEFLMHLGLNSTKDLPEFEKLVSQIKLPQTPEIKPEEPGEQKPPAAEEPVKTQPADDQETAPDQTQQATPPLT